jgi:hypothetical protein
MADEHPQLTEARAFAEKLCELARTSPDKVALAIHAEEVPVSLFANRPMRLRSAYKTAIGLAYAREVARDPSFASKMVSIGAVDKVDPGHFDGGAHANWKATLPAGTHEVSHEAIAKGMLQESSNACTQYMLDLVGHEKVNAILAEHTLELDPFGKVYDELRNPLRGSASDTAKLMSVIATKESPAVRSAFQSIALPFRAISVEHGGAAGFGKGGSGIMPIPDAAGHRHDFNYIWHVEHNGKPVSVSLLTNSLETPTKEFLEARFASFACESSCNSGFRAHCAGMFEHCIASASRDVALLKKTSLPPL